MFFTRYTQVVPVYMQEYDFPMKQRIVHSVMASLEWRVIAFAITEVFFLMTTGGFWQATLMALGLQAILFFAHFAWFFARETK
jgi:hypothetical protein